MPAAFFDFFRKINLRSPDGSTIEAVLEADSFTDELNIIRSRGVAFNPDDTTDTFQIEVDYELTAAVSAPNDPVPLTLTDVNGNTSVVNLLAGTDIQITRTNSDTIRFDVSDVTNPIVNIQLTNPIRITTQDPHGLVNGAEVTLQDINGTVELNGNSYYSDVIDSVTFDLYDDEALTQPVDGTTGFSAYVNGGVIQIQNVTTLDSLLDVGLLNVQTNDLIAFTNGAWRNVDEITVSKITGDVESNSITALANLSISSVAGGSVSLTNGGGTNVVLDHDADTVSLNAGSQVQLADTAGDVVVGNGSNTMSFVNGTTVDFANTTISNAVVNGSLTGNADTATALQTARDIGGVSFDGTANISLPGVDVTGNQDTTGNAATATALASAQNFSIAGGGITASTVSFDGTGAVVLNATIDNDAVALGTQTTGNYVATITGTSGQIEVTDSGTESAAVTLAFPNNVVIPNDLNVNGDLNVYGATTSIETTNTTVKDNLILLNEGVSNNSSDSGILIARGSAGDNAIVAWDESEDKWILGTTTATDVSTGDLTITAGTVVAGTFEGNVIGNVQGNIVGDFEGNVKGDVIAQDDATLVDSTTKEFFGNADSADAWASTMTLTLGGDLTGNVSFDGSSGVTLSAEVANNSHNHVVNNITDFTDGVEDSIDTLLINGSQTNGISFSLDKPNNALNVSLSTPTLNLVNASGVGITGTATIDLSAGSISLETGLDGEVPLGTSTSGDYVESLIAGTGISIAGGTGEGSTPTIDVATLPNSSLANSTITLSDGSNTQDVDLGETLVASGNNQITTTVGATNTLTIDHANSGATAGSYGGAANLVSVTVDSQGHVTSISDEDLPSPTINFSGAVTGSVQLLELAGGTASLSLAADLTDIVDVTISNPADGEVLVYDGNISRWVNGSQNGLAGRTTVTATTSSIADGANEDVDVTGFKGYALLTIETDAAAWVRVYTDSDARTDDSGRSEVTDPSPDAGVIAEVITTTAETVRISPGVFGYNNESPVTDTIYVNITNKSGSTQTVTADLTILQLEG